MNQLLPPLPSNSNIRLRRSHLFFPLSNILDFCLAFLLLLMEISSFPFLYQDDYSHFFSPYNPELDNPYTSIPSPPLKKRKRDNNVNHENEQGYGEDLIKKPTAELNLKEVVVASLLLLDEEDKKKVYGGWSWASSPKQPLDSNHKQSTTETMKHFYDEYGYGGDYLQQLELMEEKDEVADQLVEQDYRCNNNNNNKRARISPAAAVVTEEDHRCEMKSIPKSSPKKKGDAGSTEVAGNTNPAPHRRLWVKDRSKDWWDKCSSPDFPDSEFKKAFRMSKSTFDMVCDELDSAITKKDTMLRAAIPVKQRVAVCIWRLATGEPLRLVSKRFGLGISTCHKLVLEVCTAIKSVLMPKYLQWPDEERMKTVKQGFESLSGIPDIGGSIYTTHIPIIAPKISVAAYFNKRHTERNQKTSYSITVQGVVDHRGVFTDVCIGYPGSMPDDQVLEQSALCQRAKRSLLRDVRVVGTGGHPLLDWVLVPYTHKNLTWAQHGFNEKIGEVQKCAKDGFARLKARWSCMQKRTEVKLQDLPVVLGACCVLHNICEMKGEGIDPELNFELFDDEMVSENGLTSSSSVQVRDHIAHNLLHHGPLGCSS